MRIERVKYNDDLIKQVIELGNKNSRTLGLFPEKAYYQHATQGYLLCAHERNELLGYLLFSVTHSKGYVRIIQLCIDDNARRNGLAFSLLDKLKELFQDLLKGILLSCRKDYVNANLLWEKYGFKPRDEVRSRSKKENYLYKWWYDFGNHDLFSMYQFSTSKINVLLDANIIIKLRDRKEDEESGANFLLDDWVQEEVEYYYAPEIYNEIKRDSKERAKKN